MRGQILRADRDGAFRKCPPADKPATPHSGRAGRRSRHSGPCRTHLWGFNANGDLTDSVQERAGFFGRNSSRALLRIEIERRNKVFQTPD